MSCSGISKALYIKPLGFKSSALYFLISSIYGTGGDDEETYT